MSDTRMPLRLRAFILTARDRDAEIAAELLAQAGVETTLFKTLPELIAMLGDDVAFVMVTEEVLHDADLKPLAHWIGEQPAWSDLPFILVTRNGGGVERNPIAGRWAEALNNVTFLERPFHPTTLISIARAALKSRLRQHETRSLFEKLREGEARLRTALKAGRFGPWEFDFTNRTVLLSADFQAAFGAGGQLDLDTFFASIHRDDRAKVTAALQHSVSSGEDYAVEFRRHWPDGTTHWVDARARVVRDAGGRAQRLVGLSSDITERKAAEEALQQSNERLERRVKERTAQLQHAHDELLAQITERERTEEQLRHMQKLESIGELTGGVAHDFNNLLTAVISNVELLKKRLPPNPSLDRLIDGALQGAQRGAALTQRLLAFAHRQALDPRPVDLAGLVRDMGNLLRRSIGPGIEIELDLPDGLPAVQIDPNQIELALLNLVINARDAMPDGGGIAVSIRHQETASTPDLAPGQYVCLTVSDTGAGMDADTLKRSIEPFFSTKGLGKGTGLGLSMVHGVALQLKGALRLDSAPGHGTRASLWLPVATEKVRDLPPETAPPRCLAGATLLLVDDDFLITMSTKAMLEDLGHIVIDASSGAKALEILKSATPVDLLITDYAMPGMNGLQLARAAHDLRPGMPVLLATGYAELPSDAAVDLPRLSKPYHQRQLAEHVSALIRPSAPCRPPTAGL